MNINIHLALPPDLPLVCTTFHFISFQLFRLEFLFFCFIGFDLIYFNFIPSLFYKFFFFSLSEKCFSFSCANSTCACGQTGNHSDSGLIDNQNLLKYRAPASLHNVRSPKIDSIATYNEQKSYAARTKIAANEPIYVNHSQNHTVNYNNINNNYNNIQNHNDYYTIENDDIIKADSIINIGKMKSNYKLMGKPPSGEKHLRSFFGLSLDEREMPITRERSKQQTNTKRIACDVKKQSKLVGSPKLLRASTCDAYPSRGRNR